jgi:putative ABC transport system permease protein
MTVNILGRDITATIANLREVDFETAGIGFMMSMNPGALAGAPHTHIATVYAEPEAEARSCATGRGLSQHHRVRVRDAIDRVPRRWAACRRDRWGAAATRC